MYNRPVADQDPHQLSPADGHRKHEVPAFAPFSECDADADSPFTACVGPGVPLIDQSEPCAHVYLIREGLVKLSYASENGSHVTLGLRSAGWYAGAASVLLRMPSVYSVVTVGSCTVSRFPQEQFFFVTKHSMTTLRHVMRSVCLDSMCQARLYAEIRSNSAAERLEHFMQERAADGAQRKTMDPLPLLKQAELAELLSVTPEHLSRLRSRRMPCPARAGKVSGRK